MPFSYISSDVKAKMLAQRPLSAAASRIQRAVDQTADQAADSGTLTGFAGIGLGEGQVTVWWKGELPDRVQSVISDVRSTTKVEVVAAKHTRAELTAAADRIRDYVKANPKSPYYGVEIAYNGSGLIVDADPANGQLASAALPAAMAVPADIAVSVAEGPRPVLTGRLNDTPPYYGGGRIQNNDNGAWCTAGFPVTVGGANYMLTAGHCGRPNGGWNNGNDSRFFGTGAREHVAHDLLLVSASVTGRMWDGGVGSGEFTKGVAGSDYVFPGEGLCSSGSNAGAVCNFRVTNSFQHSYCDNDVYGNRECLEDLILADQLNGLPGSRPGDSGGPVFSLAGTDRVTAKGTITGVRNNTQLIFQDFVTAQRDFGINVITG